MIMTYLDILLNKEYTAQDADRIGSKKCVEFNIHSSRCQQLHHWEVRSGSSLIIIREDLLIAQ